MKRRIAAWVVCAAAVGVSAPAYATITTRVIGSDGSNPNGLMTTFGGVTTMTFDGGTAVPPLLTGGAVVNGTHPGQFATPYGDTSDYFIVGAGPGYIGTASFAPGGAYSYFGLYWGSVDAYNSIAFFLDGINVGTFTGDAFSPATGAQTASDTNEFVDFVFSPGTGYDTVTFTTTAPNFELDNIAFGILPEPASAALLGSGLLAAFGLTRHRRSGRNPA